MVSIILIDKNKKILLQHRTKDDKKHPNLWTFFGGSMEEGETPVETIKRECLEELEYALKNPKLILSKKIDGRNFFLFMERYDHSQKLILHEGQGMAWFSYEEINNLDAPKFVKDIIFEIKEVINSQA